jgi:signal transduction histidine kinase
MDKNFVKNNNKQLKEMFSEVLAEWKNSVFTMRPGTERDARIEAIKLLEGHLIVIDVLSKDKRTFESSI